MRTRLGRLARDITRKIAGAAGDAIHLILAAAGHNLRLLRAWLIRLLAFLLSLLAMSGPVLPLPSPQLAKRYHHVFHGREAWFRDRRGGRLAAAGLPVLVENRAQIRAFAQALGQHAEPNRSVPW
jgi:hypothetical protein